jgi:MraZ protein
MDTKNRVTVPSGWIRENEPFYLVPATNNLSVMPASELALKKDEVCQMLPPGPARQLALRQIYSSARAVEPDKQGRIVLPDDFCKSAELSGEVLFCGVESRFEIWNPAKWSNAMGEKTDVAEDVRRAREAVGL